MNAFLTPPPSWLPSLCQPADWLVCKLLCIFVVIGLITAFVIPTERSGNNYV